MPIYSTDERLQLRVTPKLRAELLAGAEREGVPLNDHVVRLICKALRWPVEDGLMPRKTPGRKPKKT